MKRKGRRLSAEEEKLWRRIADTAIPLEKPRRPTLETKPHLCAQAYTPKEPLKGFRVGERAVEAKTSTRLRTPEQPLRMDRKTYDRIRRGKADPEARIDLHGMTVEVAHSALRAFLLRSQSEGKRLVLVITGKGSARDIMGFSEVGRGILRRQVPHWLEQPPLRNIVLQTSPAHQKHGGSGALYVYLRR